MLTAAQVIAQFVIGGAEAGRRVKGAKAAHVPLVETIYRTLRQKGDGTMRDTFFLDILDEYYPDAEAERQFATAVDWGRYAELFEFDADDGRLRLSPPQERFPE